jgi:23S rRNA (cytidine1920-2'-O)/16S rRNA (cytidine1409-2'-O)-methyltransferase
LVERDLSEDVEQAKRMVLAGEVSGVDGMLTQPRMLIDPACALRLKTQSEFVSRGGDKLKGALADFAFDPRGLCCLDVGASTGGFTDCLLQHGAASVVAVDVAYGQFSWQLRNDERVTVIERTNIREADPAALGAPFDLVVADVSFTSVRPLLSVFHALLCEQATLITLIKPQFEPAGKKANKDGVVTDPAAHVRALEEVIEAAHAANLTPQAVTVSPLKGPKGNIEFFLLAQRATTPIPIDTQTIVTTAHTRLN